MPWIKFHSLFWHRPTPRVLQEFKPGLVIFATRALAHAALAVGAAELCDRPEDLPIRPLARRRARKRVSNRED